MAIATGTAIALGVSAATGAANAIVGAGRARKARQAIEDFERQELRNEADDLRVSTLGAELQTEEAQRRFATSVDALQAGGVRGLVGGLGRVEEAAGLVQRRISADLDRQQAAIQQMQLREDQQIRMMREERESQQLGALYSDQQAGRQMVASGLGQIGSAAMTGLMSMDSMQPQAPKVNPTMSPPGFAQVPLGPESAGREFENFGMDTLRKAQNVRTTLTNTNKPVDFSQFTGEK